METNYYPTRNERRSYLKRIGHFKKMESLPLEEKMLVIASNIEVGKKIQERNTTSIQNKMYDQLSATEGKMIEDFKAKGFKKEEYERFLELWAGEMLWPVEKSFEKRREYKKLKNKFLK